MMLIALGISIVLTLYYFYVKGSNKYRIKHRSINTFVYDQLVEHKFEYICQQKRLGLWVTCTYTMGGGPHLVQFPAVYKSLKEAQQFIDERKRKYNTKKKYSYFIVESNNQ